MNTSGYFFVASKFAGLTIHICTGVWFAPVTVTDSGGVNASCASNAALVCVTGCGVAAAVPSASCITSGGCVS